MSEAEFAQWDQQEEDRLLNTRASFLIRAFVQQQRAAASSTLGERRGG